MIKGATPIPFKLLTITAGFISMPLLTFIGASLVSRSISFMIVGVLFRLFGAPIKSFIDKYLGLATAGFVIVVVGGFIAAAMLSGGGEDTSAKCARLPRARHKTKPAYCFLPLRNVALLWARSPVQENDPWHCRISGPWLKACPSASASAA